MSEECGSDSWSKKAVGKQIVVRNNESGAVGDKQQLAK